MTDIGDREEIKPAVVIPIQEPIPSVKEPRQPVEEPARPVEKPVEEPVPVPA
jgi:hypothetical protein